MNFPKLKRNALAIPGICGYCLNPAKNIIILKDGSEVRACNECGNLHTKNRKKVKSEPLSTSNTRGTNLGGSNA
jgi:NMD protein affecting ribosome stability and mRNA decay